MGNEVDDKAVAKPVVGDQAEGGVKDDAQTAADRLRADAAKALPAETGTGVKDADNPNLPKVEVTGDDEAEAAKKAAADAEAAKKAAAEGDAPVDPTKKAPRATRMPQRLRDLKVPFRKAMLSIQAIPRALRTLPLSKPAPK